MRKTSIIALIIAAFSLGCFAGRRKPIITPAFAQQSAITFSGCQSTNTGGASLQCSQYLLQVNVNRGFPKFQLWQVQTQALSIDGSNGSTFANYGSGSSIDVQAFEPDPRGTQTFTMAVGEP